ncbi:MAG TPA: lysozyme [Rariglobus sp.]
MTPSHTIAAFMKGFEKLRLKAYYPTKDDKPTIGYGETNGVRMGMVWTVEKAEANFAARLSELGIAVWALVKKAPHTTQGQFDAMVSLADNIGLANFAKSSVRTNHVAGHNATAALAFLLWDKQRGGDGVLRPLRGLTRRRAAEAAIYRGDA